MNRKQKILTGLALLAFLISVVFAPWKEAHGYVPPPWAANDRTVLASYKGIIHAPIWSPPEDGYLLVASLLGTWFAIGVIYAGLFWLLKTERK